MKRNLKIALAGLLIVIASLIAYKAIADYCYTSGMNGTIVTFMSPKDYNFNFGTVYNDQYTKAGEPNGNYFDVIDTSTMTWYLPSGTWGISAQMLNTSFWSQYFSSLTVTASFYTTSGAVGSFTFSLANTQSSQIVISGVASGHIIVEISGTVNPNLPAGQINIPCTALIEWCPDSK